MGVMQATNADTIEAAHHSKLIIEKEVAVSNTAYAFVYNDNAKTKKDPSDSRFYLVKPQIVFNSQGPLVGISYNASTGALTIPSAGIYEVVYSVSPRYDTDVALAVNGKEIRPSRVSLQQRTLTKNTFLLKLAQGDHVSIILPTDGKGSSFTRNEGVGNSASLLITKL
jgi:hypothetical protein